VTRARTLGDVVPVAAVEPDGLVVTSAGAYVRLVECVAPLQPLRGGREHRDAIRDRLAALAARIPARQSLQVVVEAEPLDVEAELARDRHEIRTAAALAERHGAHDRGEALRRLGYGLEQTVRRSAPAVQATRLRWTVVVCWRPATTSWRPYLERARRSRERTLTQRVHERAAGDSLRFADSVVSELTGAGCQVAALDGTAALAALARPIRPGTEPEPATFASLPQVLDTTDSAVGLAHRQALIEAVSAGARLHVGRDWLTHHEGGELEAVMHLSGAPADTSLWWLLGLMELPPPWRLSVHLTATDRARERRSQRLRHKRLWADLRRRERDGKLIAQEAYEQEREAAELDAELRLTGASGIYEVSLYLAIRRPAAAQEQLADALAALASDFESYTDARLYGGRFLVEDAWVSTLPLAVDRLGATRRSRSAASATACRC
jgi:hypothetical protein